MLVSINYHVPIMTQSHLRSLFIYIICFILSFLFPHLLVESLDLFNLVIAAHENSRAIVDMLRLNLHHTLHLAIDSLATSYTNND